MSAIWIAILCYKLIIYKKSKTSPMDTELRIWTKNDFYVKQALLVLSIIFSVFFLYLLTKTSSPQELIELSLFLILSILLFLNRVYYIPWKKLKKLKNGDLKINSLKIKAELLPRLKVYNNKLFLTKKADNQLITDLKEVTNKQEIISFINKISNLRK